MAHHRLPGPAQMITPFPSGVHLYEVRLESVPSLAWVVAFQRPPASLTSPQYTPDIGAVTLRDATITFGAHPDHLSDWLHWIDTWIACANSVVEE